MMTQQTIDKLHDMKLTAMADAFAEQMGKPDLGELSFEDRLAMLVDRQWTFKEDRRMTRLLRTAKLRDSACIENVDFKTPRALDKSLVVRLAGSDWIKRAQNVIILGPTGVGKTYLACAIANSACRNGFAVMYKRAPRLYQEVAVARADGSYPKLMNRLSKIKILVIDDFCISPMTDPERRDLLEVLEDRQSISSTIIATQVPVENWIAHIGDPTLADAILDRLIHNAHRINLKGESMRKIRSSLTKSDKSGR
ncbi:IS21-like element helper ATPase IstB [Desulfosarcina sp.]|uniref:IS21-like element helper ATPase IstB n=1 Tax=Desulfosarcina sp. TaxID=2027861 RepID=UPI00397102E5